LYLRGAGDRRVVGPAHVGNVLGVGSTPDLRAGAAVPVPGIYGTAGRNRGHPARRPRERGPGSGRRCERSHHPLLSDLVELTAPATFGDAPGEARHAAPHAGAAAIDAAGVYAVFRRAAARAAARRGAHARARGELDT